MSKPSNLMWFSPLKEPFQIVGFHWLKQDMKYRRLPIDPCYQITEAVNHYANCTAGGQIRFSTNSSRISIRVKLTGVADLYHMPATAQCGFDCYIGDPGEQAYYATTYYDHTQLEYESMLFEADSREMRCITLNFPLYQGVEEVFIGLEPDCSIERPLQYDSNKKLIFYGTSITQGACASRPGMAYSNIISRRINLECINLGFTSNGNGEPEMAKLIADIAEPGCLVLDYEANCVDTATFRMTLPEFIRIFRERHPRVPILVVSKIIFAKEKFNLSLISEANERKELQRSCVDTARKQGDQHIYFVDGTSLIKENAQECTVDGIHPTDFGFYQMANTLTPVLEKICLNKEF